MIHTEGIQFFLEQATCEQSIPDDFWIGLASNELTVTSTMASVTELSGNGYARRRFAPGETAAEGTLTMAVNPTDGDTVTIDTVTYRFKATPAAAEDIQIGGDAAATQANLVATINGTGSAGVEYFAGTTSPHPTVKIGAFASNAAVLRARTAGAAGNSIATTSSLTEVTDGFDAASLGTTREGGVEELTSAAGGVNGRALTTADVTFAADGGNWDLALTAFITTTQTGTSGPLIASEQINDGDGVALTDGQSYDIGLAILGEPK